MTSLLQILTDIAGIAFAAEGLPAEYGQMRISDRPDLAQFQCNGAMAAARVAGKNPRAVADAVVARLLDNPAFARVEVAGPGFININVTDSFLANHLHAMITDARQGVAPLAQGETIVLDYGGPNVAKAMHVGHLRTAIIGEALRRTLKFAGYHTIGDVHMGDWGTQIGMVISEFALRHPEWLYFDPLFTGPYPAESPFTLADLEQVYPSAAQACKDDESRRETARIATVALQEGRTGYRALWKHIVDVSVASMKENYAKLNVHFDLWNGESTVHDLIAPMAQDLVARGHAVVDDGATVIPVAKNDDQKEFPPLILYKSDGAVMYGTTDLATLLDRMRMNPRPAKVIYVVDQRQALHFEQVFRAAYKTGIVPPEVELIHAGNGTMNGTDGKPFKTRAGGVLRLEDLIESATSKALEVMKDVNLAQDASAAEMAGIAHMVGVAAIKFADLQNQRSSDYIFDLDRMTSFEGKTGPYLLYQAVRIKSLLRKAGAVDAGAALHLQDQDRPLALLLTELPEVIEGALKNYMPHILCDYAYRLANAFSSFYGNCHILSETDAHLRASRLALSAAVLAQLDLLLGLLGIDIPERM